MPVTGSETILFSEGNLDPICAMAGVTAATCTRRIRASEGCFITSRFFVEWPACARARPVGRVDTLAQCGQHLGGSASAASCVPRKKIHHARAGQLPAIRFGEPGVFGRAHIDSKEPPRMALD